MRRDTVDDAVCGVQQAGSDLLEVARRLEDISPAIDDYRDPAMSRYSAELCRDMAAKLALATAKLNISAGAFRALSYEEGQTDG